MASDSNAPENVVDFRQVYEGVPPWDVGHAQPAFVRLIEAGQITGPVLDVGCGTGDLAIHCATRSADVLGIDLAPLAIAKAQAKAKAAGSSARFQVADGLALGELGRRFASVVDSGFFHTLTDASRVRFAQELAAALVPGGRYFVLGFGDWIGDGHGGPRAVTRDLLERVFGADLFLESCEETTFEVRLTPALMPARLAVLRRR